MKNIIKVITLTIIYLNLTSAVAQTTDLVEINVYKDSTILNTPLIISGTINNISSLSNVIVATYKMSSGVKIQSDTLTFSHKISYYVEYKDFMYGCSGKNFRLNVPILSISSISEEKYLRCIVSIYFSDGTKASEKEMIIVNK